MLKSIGNLLIYFGGTFLVACLLFSCSSSSESDDKKEALLLRIQIGEKYGFINEEGKIMIEPQFDDASMEFSEGLCYAQLGSKKGLIDSSGDFVVTLSDSVHSVSNFIGGLATLKFYDIFYDSNERHKITNTRNVINKEGKYILPRFYSRVGVDTIEGKTFIYVTDDEKAMNNGYKRCKFITDERGTMIGEPFGELESGFRNGLCAICLDGKWGFMDMNGDLVIDTIYNRTGDFTPEGVAPVMKDSLFFFIDKKGQQLFQVQKLLSEFGCNRAAVIINNDTCLIDKSGKKICSISVDEIEPFYGTDSLATIIKNGKASKIDTLGNVVLSTNYEKLGSFVNGIAPAFNYVNKNNSSLRWRQCGFIDLNGNEIIKVEYDTYEILPSEDNPIIIRMGKSKDQYSPIYYEYFDFKGNLIGKDLPTNKYELPYKAERKDYEKYFDSRLGDLESIEGIYYVTINDYYQSRNNPNSIGLNNSQTEFMAIIKDSEIGGYRVDFANGSNKYWVNKFVKIGNNNTFGIMGVSNDSEYSSGGKVTIDDPSNFEFRLEQGHNHLFNFFVTYEFVRDYPSVDETLKIQKAEWTGSGFAIADGYIATNYHVTSGAKNIRIKGLEGNLKTSYKAVVVASDKETDIAILRIVDKDFNGINAIPYKIGKTMVDVGEDVFVLGYPKVDTMGEEIKVTEGIISSSSGFQGNSSMYQISAAVQPGNSGGPLFDAEGTIIGIVCAKHTDAENANYAVKISNLFSLINSSNLGIKVADNNVNEKKVSNIVKKIKNYVYLIECNSR